MKIERGSGIPCYSRNELADHRATVRTIPCSGPRRQDNSSANGHDNRKIAETTPSYNSSQSADFQKAAVHGVRFCLHLFRSAGACFLVLGLYFGCAGVCARARGWSKAQKQATIRLQKYAASRNEKHYQAFLDSLSVPLGDRAAGEQL